MKRRIVSYVVLLSLLLSACGEKPPTWEEQYDLGIRYLSEGNYEEAVIAFTAAIEIDPKRASAYVGRGDAYTGSAALMENQSSDAAESYQSAERDYLDAIELDGTLAEVYIKLAGVYLAMEDTDAAIAILERGAEAVEDEELLAKLEGLREEQEQQEEPQDDRPEGASEVVTVEGYIIRNLDEYRESWENYKDIYDKPEENISYGIISYGIRFPKEVSVEVEGIETLISEACLLWDMDKGVFDEETQLYNDETNTNGSLIRQPIKVTGYFYKKKTKEHHYIYFPNGDYAFRLIGYEELN